MGRLSFILFVISVWLAVDVAVVAYLTFIRPAKHGVERIKAVAILRAADRVEHRASVVPINRRHARHSTSGSF
jgi:hypothetical protein